MKDIDKVVDDIVSNGETCCDAGIALRKLITALADANMQEADSDEDPSDEDLERESDAKAILFKVATAVTDGRRWRHE